MPFPPTLLHTTALLALTTTLTLTTAQSTCGDFVAEGHIALGTTQTCGIGNPTPNGLTNNDCGILYAGIFGPGAESLSVNMDDNICTGEPWTNEWVVGCDSEGRVTLVVHEDREYWTCEEVQGQCTVTFGGLSSGYYGKSWDCVEGP